MNEQQAEEMIGLLRDIHGRLDDNERLSLCALEIPRIRERVYFITWSQLALVIFCAVALVHFW